MKKNIISFISLALMALSSYATAGEEHLSSNLNTEREQVMHQYILDL